MFSLVIFVCYLGHGCDDVVVGAYNTEAQCLQAMDEQRLRRAGCFPIEDYIDGFWIPAQEYADF
ncbi:YebW family protein [Pectobacterium brasiliense]|uniref:YebW family protein n=1 Tax=Pectobacterium brasiliense TaxID=180957 RepID=A0AAW9HG65_9GAMM|nr:YebW family protein [Pectobacterium brasiliense]MDY4380323.1 YebW family protein [Pectobacterium brasiliense]